MKAIVVTTVLTCMLPNLIRAQFRMDTLRYQSPPTSVNPVRETSVSQLFQNFAGGINTLVQGNQASGSFDLSVQTYHYFLVTGRRYKNDSLHRVMQSKARSYRDLYKGFHFYLLNRASIDFDTIRAIANNYITSLIGSPLTIRINKEFFLTKAREITASSLTPVLSLILTGDSRIIPYGNRNDKINFGTSAHFYLSFSALFKRVEFDKTGREMDNGTMYLRPIFGLAYGNPQLMRSITPGDKLLPVLTSGCRIGFKSELNKVKDFSFLLNYTISDIIGPKLRAGILLGTGS